MPRINKFNLALLISAVSVGGALAADPIAYPTSVSQEPVAVYDNSGFDWTGFYAGVYGSVQDYTAGNWEYGLGVDVGANYQYDFFVLGAELAVSGLTNGTTGRGYGQALGRAGVVVTDDILLYAAGGYGGDFSSGDRHWLAGGGIEYAINDAVSLRGQYLHGFAATAASTDTNQFTIGANYHF